MKSTLQLTLLISCTLLFFTNVHAGEKEKKFSIGLGTYGFTVDYTDSAYINREFGGLAINATFAANNNIGIKGAMYSLEADNDDYNVYDGTESSGYDLTLIAGTGLATEGFKIYGGLGIFNDTWSKSGYSDAKFSGLQLVGGLGYNWKVIALEFSFGIREADEYQFNADVAAAVSAGLIVSVRL